METLKLNKATAIRLYPKADAEFKEMLTETFGAHTFSQKITDRVKTFEDACKALGFKYSTNPIVDNVAVADYDAVNAFAKLCIIARALNEGWQPNWKDSSEYKYYPWFDLSSGSGLSFSDCVDWGSRSAVGSRLCFKSRELAEYAGKKFKKLYEQYFLL